jgi:hypothetical protein
MVGIEEHFITHLLLPTHGRLAMTVNGILLVEAAAAITVTFPLPGYNDAARYRSALLPPRASPKLASIPPLATLCPFAHGHFSTFESDRALLSLPPPPL